ncbi:MAG: hypothetical protein Unbinned4026contig1003_5 [Prokaryotic dsDNA virus sp.]|nr:MAG: hypothetical protein Unbinned4026contig1003_5 [Prokaryotic dsDNA virus sp.]|tara:strand:- start:1997 stop:2398 length:402 start_codon:yes stop_codon:yes gene_type:complete
MNRYFTNNEIYNERLAICNSCDYFFKPTGQCKKCLCFMSIKARLSFLSCPINKWRKTTEVEMPKDIPAELIEEAIKIYPDIKTGRAKNHEVKYKMIELYNTIYNTNYDKGTSCRSCLSTCLKGIKNIYIKYGK